MFCVTDKRLTYIFKKYNGSKENMNRFTISAILKSIKGKPISSISLKNVRCFSSSSDKMIVEIDSQSGIATMYANNAPVNSLDSGLLTAAVKAVKEAERNPDVRGILLTSKFDGQVFCAGLNILDMYQKSHQHLVDYWTMVQDWYLAWYGCKKPTVAAINGHAPAGGCAWSMMCDYRIMQSGAGKTIGLNETMLGIVAPFFFVELIQSTIGHRASEEALLKGLLLSAEDALKYGMIDDIEKLENLNSKAIKELKAFMAINLNAYQGSKMLLRQDVMKRLIAVKKEDAEFFANFVSQPQVQESIGNYVASLKARKK
ncbi:enoyl-CoA delta isomerase 1, mitochondrial-like [Styela clava]